MPQADPPICKRSKPGAGPERMSYVSEPENPAAAPRDDGARRPPTEQLLAAGHNLVNDLITRKVMEGLRDGGTRPILLKGASLRRMLYAVDEQRVSNDIDLLVDSVELAYVEGVLPELGFRFLGVDRLGAGRNADRLWMHESTGFVLELHTTIVGIGAAPTSVWETLSAATETMDIDGHPVEILDDVARAFHVAINVAHHGRLDARTLADLDRALTVISQETWRNAADLARRLDALAAFSTGLRLNPRGALLVQSLGIAAPIDPMIALRAETAPPLAPGIVWFTQLPSAKARAAYLLRVLMPPPVTMRLRSPRARRNCFWLILAYAGRPFWIVAHLRPAIRAWRRAHQTSRASKLRI